MVTHVPGTCMYHFLLEQHAFNRKNDVCCSSPERVKRSLTKSLLGFHSCFESGSPCSVALLSPVSEQIVQLIRYGKKS